MHKLNSTWSVWRRELNNYTDWSINSYKKVYTFNTIEDFWKFFKDIKFYDYNFYIMRGNVQPMYEDVNNKDGCQVTYLSKKYNFMREFEHLLVHLISENICDQALEVNGVSFAMKQRSVVMQLWMKNKQKVDRIRWRYNTEDFSRRKVKLY